MTAQETAKKLHALKKLVTKTGYAYLKPHLPVEIGITKKIYKPFAAIERAIDKAILELNKL